MRKTEQEITDILTSMRNRLPEVYGARFKRLFLFGSYARGEAVDDSDIDIAVVLDKVENRFAEQRRCGELQSEISLRFNCVVNVFIVSTEELEQGEFALLRNVVKEGIQI